MLMYSVLKEHWVTYDFCWRHVGIKTTLINIISSLHEAILLFILKTVSLNKGIGTTFL